VSPSKEVKALYRLPGLLTAQLGVVAN